MTRIATKKEVTALQPEEVVHVPGTWATCELARQASAWLFVYPREPGLLNRYLDEYGHGDIRKIVWLGPKVDWSAFVDVVGEIEGWDAPDVTEDCGAAEYEMLVVIQKPN